MPTHGPSGARTVHAWLDRPATVTSATTPGHRALRVVLVGRRNLPVAQPALRYASCVAVRSSQLPTRWGCWSASRCWINSSQVTWLTSLASAWQRPRARVTARTSPPVRSTS
jgi:hypothetical protein